MFFRPMSVSPFLSSMSAFLSFRIPTQSILGDTRQQLRPSMEPQVSKGSCLAVSLDYSHHSHVVLWLQRDLQHFGPVHHPLHAGRGNSLPGDAVDLVKGVRFQDLLIRCADIDLEPHLSCALVPAKLIKKKERTLDM